VLDCQDPKVGTRNAALVPRTDGLGKPALPVGPPHCLGYQVSRRILDDSVTMGHELLFVLKIDSVCSCP